MPDNAQPAVIHPPPRRDVITLSASVLPSERDAALASGASLFLEKPYVPSELISVVGSSLVRRDGGPAG